MGFDGRLYGTAVVFRGIQTDPYPYPCDAFHDDACDGGYDDGGGVFLPYHDASSSLLFHYYLVDQVAFDLLYKNLVNDSWLKNQIIIIDKLKLSTNY